MTGLDISNKMVHLARAKNLYTRVMQVLKLGGDGVQDRERTAAVNGYGSP